MNISFIKKIAARLRPSTLSGSPAPQSRLRTALSWSFKSLRFCLANRYAAFLIFIVALAYALHSASGLSSISSHASTELPLLLLIYWALNFILRPGRISPFVAALPFAVFYVGYDVFYMTWGNIFKAIDAQSLPELLKVLPIAGRVGLLFILFLPIVLVICFIDYRKYRRVLSITTLAALLIASLEMWPSAALTTLSKLGFEVAEWSDAQTINQNGRLASTLYFEGTRRQALAETESYRAERTFDNEVNATSDFLRARGNRRNVHLIVLESFIDPTLFEGVTFSQTPRHPDFAKLVGDQQSFSISPVFGGETAQAEFEALCGVPALQKLSEIEFDDFSGEPTGCMPRILARAGYSTTVSNAFEPNYFNSTKAYTGIGFENIYFPAEYSNASSTYLSVSKASSSETYVFDGDLFDQNLAFVAKKLHESPNRPILNYVLGIYGHEPHDIDTTRRPLVVSVNSVQRDQQLLRAANQYWYRTQAIAHYIQQLIKLDPKGLIVIVSDHLPHLDKGVKSYQEFRYLSNVEDSTHLNRILIVENGRVVRHNTIHHYQIPSLVYDYLTSKEFCTKLNCRPSKDALRERYMSLMARAVGR